MSGENRLSSFGNFENRLKTRYSTDFGVGPIEYMYACVCGTWTSFENQNIYGLKSNES
jgi:hypothetical protein